MNQDDSNSLGVRRLAGLDWHDPETWKHLRMGWLTAAPAFNAELAYLDEELDGLAQSLHRQHFFHGVTARDHELLAGTGIRLE